MNDDNDQDQDNFDDELEERLRQRLTEQAQTPRVQLPSPNLIGAKRDAIVRKRRVGRMAFAAVFVAAALMAGNLVRTAPGDTNVEAASGTVTRGRFKCVVGNPAETIHLILWMRANASPDDIAFIEDTLLTSESVRTVRYVTQGETFTELQALWADSPQLLNGVEKSNLPSSFRISLTEPNAGPPFELSGSAIGFQNTPFNNECQSTNQPGLTDETLAAFCADAAADLAAEFIVWMNVDATETQVSAVGVALETATEVDDFTYVNRSATYAEFEVFWADSPEVLEAIDPQDLPTSFRVVTSRRDLIPKLAERLGAGNGVLRVETDPDFEAYCEQADQDRLTNWLESILN